MKALVTGAGGQLGRELLRTVLDTGEWAARRETLPAAGSTAIFHLELRP